MFSDDSATSSGSEGLGFLGRGGPITVALGDSDVVGSSAAVVVVAVLGGGGPMAVVMVFVSDVCTAGGWRTAAFEPVNFTKLKIYKLPGQLLGYIIFTKQSHL